MCETEGMLAARMMEDKPCRIKEWIIILTETMISLNTS